MKKIIYLALFLINVTCFSQQNGRIELKWNDKTTFFYGDNKVTSPKFNDEYFNFDYSKMTIAFGALLKQDNAVDESSLSIVNIIYEPITTNELGDLSLNEIPNKVQASLKSVTSRNQKSAYISFCPIIKTENGFEKVVAFEYSFKSGIKQNKIKKSNAIMSSVLASGSWYRFYVEKSGVYKISKSFLNQLGFNTNIDPKTIKIYGNGGRMLPLSNKTDYPIDLEENAVQFIGENDGVFNDNDYILFYAEGVDNWNEESLTHTNLYSSKSYYYVTADGNFGKRIQTLNQPTEASTLSITSFDDYQFHEVDLTNVVKTGRRWLGESFNVNNIQEFTFDFPNIITSNPITLNISGGAAAFTNTTLRVEANGNFVNNINFPPIYSNSGTELNLGALPGNSTITAAEKVVIKLTYNNGGVPSSKGYLDYIALKAKRKLKGYGKQFMFQYNDAETSTEIANYQFENATNIKEVFDVTDIYNVTKIENNSSSNFSFKSNLGEVRKYVAVDENDYYTPLTDSQSRIINQDLKGTIFKNSEGVFTDIDYIIVSPAFLSFQAEKLANFHRTHAKLNVKVVTLESIYEEFSSGKQDVAAIRNFIKYVYNNASSDEKKIKYINLFGDASYDFKDRIPNNTNIVPIYHSLNSTTIGESSFASDDFFGLMDDNEGNVTNFFGGIDISVGRMIVDNTQQAEDMVQKTIDYHDTKSLGNWRNNYVLIADDSDKISDATLQNVQNTLADKVVIEKPFINTQKIFLDAYVQETSSGGNRYPKAKEDIFNAFEKGALIFNYLGHGGEDGLTGERIWEKSDGQNLSNQFRYPLFITITCDFSRFDNPFRPTAGEYTYWNPKGGAISMITTIRTIGQYSAEIFNATLSKYLLSYGSNEYVSIAESLRLAKNSSPNSSTNVVFYLGDPALMLAIPKPKIQLTKVNDVAINQSIPNLESLGFTKLTGEIVDENNQIIANYNGEIAVNVYDKLIDKKTLNNDGNSPSINFSSLGETIFRGNASVKNGTFEIGFVVPRDIRIPVGNGRISFYAKNNQNLLDNTGIDTSIKIGGISSTASTDNIAPKVKLYMNDQTFVAGGITNTSPIFIAYLEDENGINTASGIGHDIIAILDGNENNPYILNDYYETDLDNYKKGSLKFPFRNLSSGVHTISFKAWDVYNNPITTEIQFVVVNDDNLTLTNVLNYPNPFVNYTQFWFTHNKPFEPLEVQVQVFTVSGKIVWTKNQTITTDGFLSRDITWDGRDDFGDKIGKGVYIYKLTVKSTLSNKKSEKFEKLVIL